MRRADRRTAVAGAISAHRLLSRGFVADYVVTMRPYLLFVSGITGIAGLALAAPLTPWRTVAAGTAFFLSYGFGQGLTDCFQLDTDSLSAPYRPLVRGRLRRAQVLGVSLAGLLLCGATLVVLNPANLAIVLLAVAGLATYTYCKRRWWAGPPYNAGIVVLVLLAGYLCGGNAGGGRLDAPGLLAAAVVCFFGYANFVLTGYFKDLTADRLTGYRTLPVEFGLNAAAVVSHLLAALMVAGVCGAVAHAASGTTAGPVFRALGAATPFIGAAVLSVLVGQLRLRHVCDESEAHRAITPVVHAYVLALAGLAILARPEWVFALAAFYIAFVRCMARRPMEQQI